jgi:uncharacterized protein YecT (DUF1311 family)
MLLAIVIAIQAAGLPQDVAEGCTDREGTNALASCYSERLAAWERRLSTAYAAALGRTRGPQRAALRSAQRDWLRFRRSNCRFYSLQAGTIRVTSEVYCDLDLTRRRVLELEDFSAP